jgi:uncharacterized protein YaiL (DUF2058 family)
VKLEVGEGFIAQKTCDGKEYLASQSTPGITAKKERQEKSRPHRPVGLAATDETAKAAASRRTPKAEESRRKDRADKGRSSAAPLQRQKAAILRRERRFWAGETNCR